MNHSIIGTAGHVDHGKTCLIKALTGIDTDRLEEEKKRGITIELGFAYLALPDGSRAGIVDVPGHERFIKNMLAGAGGIDLALLVIAADEGVMPQTREHLAILSMLDIKSGVVALTKADSGGTGLARICKRGCSTGAGGNIFERRADHTRLVRDGRGNRNAAAGALPPPRKRETEGYRERVSDAGGSCVYGKGVWHGRDGHTDRRHALRRRPRDGLPARSCGPKCATCRCTDRT